LTTRPAISPPPATPTSRRTATTPRPSARFPISICATATRWPSAGRPFTVALNSNLDQSNTGRTALGFGANDRPNVTGNPESANPTESAWFNTAAFSLQPFGSFGNAGRNLLIGPGLATFNFSMVKNMQPTEQLNVQFRTEFFNLFDRTNYDLPDNFFGSPTFGRILSAGQPRRIQFGLKLLW
jgi:hypothetical protein